VVILAKLVLFWIKLLSKMVSIHELIILFVVLPLCVHVHRFWVTEIVIILNLLLPCVAHFHQGIIGLVELNLIWLSCLAASVVWLAHIVIITVIVVQIHECILLQHIWILVVALIHVELLAD